MIRSNNRQVIADVYCYHATSNPGILPGSGRRRVAVLFLALGGLALRSEARQAGTHNLATLALAMDLAGWQHSGHTVTVHHCRHHTPYAHEHLIEALQGRL